MFGIGFFELVVIAVAALVIVGPKKLPELMRQAGKMFVHIRRTTNDVRSTFDQVIKDAEDDLRKQEIADLKNILSPKSIISALETESKPVDDNHHGHTHADGSHSPDGSHSYNPYNPDYFADKAPPETLAEQSDRASQEQRIEGQEKPAEEPTTGAPK